MRSPFDGGNVAQTSEMLSWEDVEHEFIWEGSLRDICILDTSMSDWRSTWLMLEASDLAMTFTIDGVETARPANVDHVFAQRLKSTVLSAVIVGGVQLNCHFFGELEVEFDLDPREVVGQAQFDAVASFMGRLAAATGKPVVMTPESSHATAFLRITPSGIAQYISTGGYFRELAEQR